MTNGSVEIPVTDLANVSRKSLARMTTASVARYLGAITAACMLAACGGGGGAGQGGPPPIDTSPTITVISPVPGSIWTAPFELHGTVSDDKPNTVLTITSDIVSLPDTTSIEITLETAQSSFRVTMSPELEWNGQRTLRLRATDSAGNVTTKEISLLLALGASFALDGEAIATYGAGTTLLAAGSGALLYQLPDGTVRRRNADGSEVELQGAAEITVTPRQLDNLRRDDVWSISGNRVTVAGRSSSSGARVFVFDANGARTEIPYSFESDESEDLLRSRLTGSWLVWGERRIYMRDLDSTAPAKGPVVGRLVLGHAFLPTAGNEQLFFSRESSDTSAEIWRYSLVDDVTIPLTAPDGGLHGEVKTNGSLVAWRRDSHQLLVAPVDDPTAVVTSSVGMSNFYLEPGLLVFAEAGFNARSYVRIDDGISVTTAPPSLVSTHLESLGNGHVLFGDSGDFGRSWLRTWDKEHGTRMVGDIAARQILQDGDDVYFTMPRALASPITIYHLKL